jgi:hypothetical protein
MWLVHSFIRFLQSSTGYDAVSLVVCFRTFFQPSRACWNFSQTHAHYVVNSWLVKIIVSFEFHVYSFVESYFGMRWSLPSLCIVVHRTSSCVVLFWSSHSEQMPSTDRNLPMVSHHCCNQSFRKWYSDCLHVLRTHGLDVRCAWSK